MTESQTRKTSKFLILLQAFVIIALAAGLAFCPGSVNQAKAIPTLNIVSVVKDVSVTIQTSTFPADKLFTVRMGYGNTNGSGGVVVATTNSGAGGAFQETYLIPDILKGQDIIAIRMDAPGGYYAYNYFRNDPNFLNPASAIFPAPPTTTTADGTVIASSGYKGIPTFSISDVVEDSKVTIKMHNFPADRDFTVRMGYFGTLAKGGEVVGTTNTGEGGELEETYEIPASLRDVEQIAIRMDASTYLFSYNWFFNRTTSVPGSSGTGGTGGTGGAGGEGMTEGAEVSPTVIEPPYAGTPSFAISEVERDSTVTIVTTNMPLNTEYTVYMGQYGSMGVGGSVSGTGSVTDNGNQRLTFIIPDSLKGSDFVALRLEASNGYYAYNWFRNLSTNPAAVVSSFDGPTPTPVSPLTDESAPIDEEEVAPVVSPNVSSDYNAVPSFTISSVVKDSMVSIFAKDFPADQTFTVRMGEYGTAAVGGKVISTTDTGKGGDFTATYTIPDELKGSESIAIRMDSTSGYYAFNWFYNSSSR
ncbi:MAG: hypothetical protein GX577_02650 [Leptolinea sp.]|nr:hypothetical protein [Leptolinea sp.]